MSLTRHKRTTKRIIRDAGVPTTDFFVAETPGETDDVHFSPPYFVKRAFDSFYIHESRGLPFSGLIGKRIVNVVPYPGVL